MTAATICEGGITAAICYFVAKNPSQGRDVVKTGALILFVSGLAVGVAGILAAPWITTEAVDAFRMAFIAQPLIFAGACWVFALQATSISAWNLVRVMQPAAYCILIFLVVLGTTLTVTWAVWCLTASIALQALLAAILGGRTLPGRGRVRRDVGVELARYGSATTLSSIPLALASRLDVLLLAVLVEPAQLGRYTVANSIIIVGIPLCSAFGLVAMPRLAAYRSSEATEVSRRSSILRITFAAVSASLLSGTLIVIAVSAAAPFFLVALLGEQFRGGVDLLWIMAGGVALIGCNRTMHEILRGLGENIAVARCELIDLVAKFALVVALTPTMGIYGAAIASSVASGITFILLLRSVLGVLDIPLNTVLMRSRQLISMRRGPFMRKAATSTGRGSAV
ncbi:Membrane protein involved in the export of O-antigen and teichoic acid [Parafrankia irregularis]|uniref:Membrane protein involved in the export of O-antigen and teichoic acid n=2 Tax=Frankiaceae TaxID=74712 RepID=A0A0S4QEW8_9ACTN|nr:Membrane protein involved in the export of O-antigen and teichoic acid [Parafrankia irregularis]